MEEDGIQVSGLRYRFNHLQPNIDDLKKEFVDGIQGRCVGMIPWSSMKAECFKGVQFPTVLPDIDFTPMEGASTERSLQERWTECLLRAQISPRLKLIDSSNKKETAKDPRPDCDNHLLPEGEISEQYDDPTKRIASKMDFHRTAGLTEFKKDNEDDPFEPYKPPMLSCENENPAGCATRGQICVYVNERFARQPLCFQYLVTIVGIHAHITRFDRAGLVVSELFNYGDNPSVFAEFYWAITHLSREKLGWDATATEATAEETQLLRDSLEEFKNNGISKPDTYTTFDPKVPVYRLSVNDDNDEDNSRNVIVSMPINVERSVPGRGTKWFIGYDMKDRRLVYVKDTWAPSHPAFPSEGQILKDLDAQQVSGISKLICGGKVGADTDREWQTTATQDIASAYSDEPWLGPTSKYLQPLVHERYVFEIAYPVTSLRRTKDVIWVFRDVAIALGEAYRNCEVVHRDIHPWSIMVTYEGGRLRGRLDGWDRAGKERYVTAEGEPPPVCDVTWQFMSVPKLLNYSKGKAHRLIDDMERLFWCLIYVLTHHADHNQPDLIQADSNFFDEYKERNIPTGKKISGGAEKKLTLDSGDFNPDSLQFASTPLNDLGLIWAEKLRRYHFRLTEKGGAHAAELTQLANDLGNPYWVADLLYAMWEKQQWKDADMGPDRFPTKPRVQNHREGQRAGLAAKTGKTDAPLLQANTFGAVLRKPQRDTIAGWFTKRKRAEEKAAEEAAGTTLVNPRPAKKTRKKRIEETANATLVNSKSVKKVRQEYAKNTVS